MAETRESMTMEVAVQLSTLMALALPMTRMVVLLHREIRIECDIEASISSVWPGLSKFSTSHLFPSSSLRGGLFVRMLSGLGFFEGRLPTEFWLEDRLGPEGTVAF